MSESRRQRREHERQAEKRAVQIAKATATDKKERFNDALGLISFACGLAAWGWSVIAPNSSATFGSILLLIAVVATIFAVRRMWSLNTLASIFVATVVLIGFGAFDRWIVIAPQRGKPFQDLLVHGYHLTSECGNLGARQPMPDWLNDESQRWQAQVDQLVTEKLPAKDSRLWLGAIVIGKVSDKNLVAYQCTWLATKVAALETIVSTEFDPGLKHRDYTGPTYWFEAVNGKVDISEALKAGAGQSNIAIEDFGKTSDQPTQVTGSVSPPAKH